MIPSFDEDGNIPPGIHDASWDEISARFGSTAHRLALLDGLDRALDSLHGAGCRRAYLDGSFVTAKEQPGDFDACWEIQGVEADLLDPVLLGFDDLRAAQKAKFGGELFPAELGADPHGTTFLHFFQRAKNTGNPKGIIGMNLGDL